MFPPPAGSAPPLDRCVRVLPAHGDQTAMFESMHAAPLTQRERDRVRHLLGDRNAAQSEWPTVHATLPEDQSKL